VFNLIVMGILGALIGSFGNVVIYRLPKKLSIVFPGSSCPHCAHKIRPWENIPLLSWLFLGGKCSSCKKPISIRYPLIEALTAAGFVLLAWRWPLESHGLSVLPLLIIYAMLVMMSLIDIDHYILPDSLTLPAVGIGLLGALLYSPESGLPNLNQALLGGALGAGILALINRVGSLVVRRFADTKERLWPIGMDQVNVAAVGGALGGWVWGLGATAASVLVNVLARRPVRLPELPLYGVWLLALLMSGLGLLSKPVTGLSGTFAAAGIVSIVGAVFWWFRDIIVGEAPSENSEADDEPVAMGFGDVKLAAVLGIILGWQALLVALLLSFLLGAIGGIIMRLLGGGRLVPFGPYLALGGMLALFFGADLFNWYISRLGL
jgi:leader peptidase (prepilin peptidase) / N-methyltransferase